MQTLCSAISVGCNAVTNAVDWSPSGLIAYAASKAIAIYDPSTNFGVHATLIGHTARVTSVRWADDASILSGSADCCVRIWRRDLALRWRCVQTIEDHTKSISSITICDDYLVSTSMDGSFKIYRYSQFESIRLLQSISYKPSIPLSCAMARLPGTESFVIAVGGTSPTISLYGTCTTVERSSGFELRARLPGHEDWIRAFDLIVDQDSLLLASASQDRYVRLWRIDRRQPMQESDSTIGVLASLTLLENKAHDFSTPDGVWKASFEALLVSHEDWVFSVAFSHDENNQIVLLSSSADSSVIVWYPDAESQIWTVQAQLGVISTKGASTATGSTGGFWGAIFSPATLKRRNICAWNKTGSLRIWQKDVGNNGEWKNVGGVGGHVKEVRSLSWAPNGEFFLTTSLDQSTRLWAKHKDGTWKEFARPQIHGYDIQSIHVMSPTLFISGAEEKIVRVFQATSSVVDLLARVAGIDFRHEDTAQAANVPALGLSNKALTSTNQGTHLDRSDLEESIEKDATPISKIMLDTLRTPPLEDHLQRHTLFPELEKLYGHGYEIQALTSSHDKKFIVSGCRATTPDHAVLRVYDAHKYKELAVLEGHSLTVTKARFSRNDKFLLSVSRDRSLCIYLANEAGFKLFKKIAKAHRRIIWDCAWLGDDCFATASRDGTVSVWSCLQDDVIQICNLDLQQPATAVAWSPMIVNAEIAEDAILAIGLEDGTIVLCKLKTSDGLNALSMERKEKHCDGAITGLEFRSMNSHTNKANVLELAICSEDCSVRVLDVDLHTTPLPHEMT